MLSQESLAQIDHELTKYPETKKRSAIMSALRIAQTECGYLSNKLIAFVANYLQIPTVQALEVATFYSMYRLKPCGKYTLTICTNLPCALGGAIDTVEYLQQKLGIKFNETSSDGKFTLIEGECMGACGDAPVVLVNNHKLCAKMTVEAIEQKLMELQ